jgi:hypothetical protein
MFRSLLLTSCLLVIILIFGFPSSTHAYLDPGTGSYIFQLILAAIVGLGFVVKIYWKRIRAFFTGMFSKATDANHDENEDA